MNKLYIGLGCNIGTKSLSQLSNKKKTGIPRPSLPTSSYFLSPLTKERISPENFHCSLGIGPA